jgi:hypothetical protein
MMRILPTRLAKLLPFAAASCLSAFAPLAATGAQAVSSGQSKPSASIPVTAPTSFVATTTAAPTTPAQRPARRADVKYEQGMLAVTADNSSLNQILREIGRTTGIKITGGVADERVFGKYGPLPTAAVLDALLDGTGSNMLFVKNDSGAPGELILTPRHGGVTPPNPNAPGFDDDAPTAESLPPPQPAPVANPSQPTASQPGATPAPAATTTPGTDASDPNAVKTPQQIFEQLQRLRQQQQPPTQ